MQIYPLIKESTNRAMFDMLSFIGRARKDDVQAWDNLPNMFMSGRKVGKVPVNSTDIAPTDRVGDFNYDDTYYYFVVELSPGVAQWRTLPVTNFTGGGGGLGTVTSVSVVSANGLAGTVATPFTTPAITLSTSITGILRGNGTAISAATAGVDYANTGQKLSYFATTSSAELAGVISDETGTGLLVFATSPSINTPIIKVSTRVVTAAGAVAVTASDYYVGINKTVGAATTVNLPAGVTGMQFIIKDEKGDAATNNITITPTAGNIDNAVTFVMSTNNQSATVVYNGTQWTVN